MAKLYVEIDTSDPVDWAVFKERKSKGIVLSTSDAIEVTQKLLDEDELIMISAMSQDIVGGIMYDVVPLQEAVDRALTRHDLPLDTELPIFISALHCDENEKGN